MNRVRELLTEWEPLKWAVQNSLGMAVCLLFALVPQLKFTKSCEAAVFYAVSSTAFSIDRSIGGRMAGGLLWIGVFLSGGLLGCSLVSLAWLARGDGVPVEGLSDTTVTDPLSIPPISSWFYITVIIIHVFVGVPLMWSRGTASSTVDVALSQVSQVFVSVLFVFGMFVLPSQGLTWLWRGLFISLLKSGLVACLAMFVNSCFVYVRSSHDDVRRSLLSSLCDLGELLSRVASDLNMVALGNKVKPKASPTSVSIMQKTLDAQQSMNLSAMEPAIPGVFCSFDDDSRKFGLLTQKLQVHLGSIMSVEKITKTLVDGLSAPSAAQTKVISGAALITSTLAALVSEMGDRLRVTSHNGVFRKATNTWKPHDLVFWDTLMGKLAECMENITDDLEISATRGLERALEEELDGPVTDVRGDGIALLASLESVVDEVIGLELMTASTLGLGESDLDALMPGAAIARPWYRYNWALGFITNLFIGTGVYIWWRLVTGVVNFAQEIKALLARRARDDEKVDIVKAAQRRREVMLFWKAYIAYQLSFVGVVLITWLIYGSTGSYVQDTQSVATWISNWYPEYFFLAVAICLQDTVDSSVYKTILRVSLVALGGGLAIAAVSNAALLASPWYIFWIAMMVHFVASLAANISYDFRYSLFLFTYTFAGIFVCSYGQTFSRALQIYAGKSAATALGALYAALITNVMFPTYVSEKIAEFEAALLGSYMEALTKCFDQGRRWTSPVGEGAPGELWDSRYPRLGYKSDDHAELNQDLLIAAGSRLEIIDNLFKEISRKSLDKHFMFFLEITLLPLPPSLKLIFGDIGSVGMFTIMSVRVLRSSFLRGSAGNYSVEISRLFDQTESLFAAVQDVCRAVRVFLVNTTVQEDNLADLKAKILVLQAERATLASLARGIALCGSVCKADVRTAAWYTMLLRGCKELAGLAKRLDERADYQSKDNRWTFKVQLPRRDV
jgi:hypothetical protein